MAIGGAKDASFSDDGGDVFSRSYVKGGVADADAMRSKLLAAVVGNFNRCAFFNGDEIAGGSGAVDCGPRCGDVKGDAVFPGKDGDGVGADFIRCISVGGDAVCSDDDGLDATLAHEDCGHVVA